QPEFTDKTLSRKPGAVHIADIEISRQFWRDGEHVISDILDYSAGAGFRDICADSGLNVKTAAQFRELLKFKNLAGVL
ncbi:hypothetical protein Q0Q88_13800, partial [Escherichia coli O74:H39]